MRGVRHMITHYFQKKSREVLELEALLEAQARRKKLEEQERMEKSFDETLLNVLWKEEWKSKI